MDDMMAFPKAVEEFMEQYKIVDTEKIYTNGTELVPIFRMKQWFDHLQSVQQECEDAVSREYLRDMFQNLCNANCPYSKKQREIMCSACLLGDALAALDSATSVTPKQPGWILTSERLPEDNEEVLFCDREGERWLGWHYGFWRTERLDIDEDDVVAWMPLPEPYRPEREEP